MARYVKQPIVVEAVKFEHDDFVEWKPWVQKAFDKGNLKYAINGYEVRTLEGTMHGYNGSYLVKGVDGELYPCKGDIFEKTYRRID